MSKIYLTAFLACILSYGTIAEENKDAGTGFYGQFGYNWFQLDASRRIKDNDDFYLGLGYQFNENWAADVKYSESDFYWKWDAPFAGKGELKYYAIDAIYRLQPRNESSFFWKAGLGKLKFDGRGQGGPHFIWGLGYEQKVSDQLSLVVGLDAPFTSQPTFHDYAPYLGVNYLFNKPKSKTPVKQASIPKDSDKDGVLDMNDRCPNTPANRKVDTSGCQLDSDKDGVVDHLDQCPNTPAGAKVDEKGCRIILTENVSIALNVQFANDSNVITPAYHDEINKVAQFMKKYPDTNVVIEGHTDSRGSQDYNQKLSQKRANAVMNYLTDKLSIKKSRVSAEGKGESSPIASNDTAEGRAANRRVQAEIKAVVSKPQ